MNIINHIPLILLLICHQATVSSDQVVLIGRESSFTLMESKTRTLQDRANCGATHAALLVLAEQNYSRHKQTIMMRCGL